MVNKHPVPYTFQSQSKQWTYTFRQTNRRLLNKIINFYSGKLSDFRNQDCRCGKGTRAVLLVRILSLNKWPDLDFFRTQKEKREKKGCNKEGKAYHKRMRAFEKRTRKLTFLVLRGSWPSSHYHPWASFYSSEVTMTKLLYSGQNIFQKIQ